MADSGLSFAICLRLQYLAASASDQLEDRSTPAEIGRRGKTRRIETGKRFTRQTIAAEARAATNNGSLNIEARHQRLRPKLSPAILIGARGFSFGNLPVTSPSLITGDTYEEWKKETRLDIRASSGTEILGAKENASEKNCQVAKALRRSNSAKGVQHGIVAQLARLTNQSLKISQVRYLN